MMETKTLLRDQIERDIKELGRAKMGSEEYQKGADGLQKLISSLNEMEKNDIERRNFDVKLESDEALRVKELDTDKKDRLIRNGLMALNIIASLGVLVWGTKVNWRYEKEGYIPSTNPGRMFVNGFNTLLNKKR